ncbi:MAG: hypothetical protein AAB453_01150 [Patescibacteria group bacterium]
MNHKQGFGLFGLLITFAIIILMLWYSLDLLKPVKEQTSVIESANQVKNLVESQSQKSAELSTE